MSSCVSSAIKTLVTGFNDFDCGHAGAPSYMVLVEGIAPGLILCVPSIYPTPFAELLILQEHKHTVIQTQAHTHTHTTRFFQFRLRGPFIRLWSFREYNKTRLTPIDFSIENIAKSMQGVFCRKPIEIMLKGYAK